MISTNRRQCQDRKGGRNNLSRKHIEGRKNNRREEEFTGERKGGC